jgi:integrase
MFGNKARAKTGIYILTEWFDYVIGETSEHPYHKKRNITPEMIKVKDYHLNAHKEYQNLIEQIEYKIDSIDKSKEKWFPDLIFQIKDPMHGKITLLNLVDKFISELDTRITRSGKLLENSTKTSYYTFRSNLKKFIIKNGNNDIRLEELTEQFKDKYLEYNRDESHTLNYIGGLCKSFKAILIYASNLGLCKREQALYFTKMEEEIENVYLDDDELKAIRNVELNDDTLKQTRDSFMILAFTGVRYSDLSNVLNTPIEDHTITFTMQKTNEKVTIPITNYVSELINELKSKQVINYCLMNDKIKHVARLAGINKQVIIKRTKGREKEVRRLEKWQFITTHTARRSFATNAYKTGLDWVSISEITGHKSDKNFKKYIKLDKK